MTHCTHSFLGQPNDFLRSIPQSTLLIHPNTLQAFDQLKAAGLQNGFELKIESAWRSFDRQLSIWNHKAKGELPVNDRQGHPMDIQGLDPGALVDAILIWSALPGTSRHHWGSDIDIFDARAVPAHYEVQLSPQEVAAEGPFGPMHQWLDQRIACNQSFGFFRPFVPDRGSIQPERWHLSHRPTALEYQKQFSAKILEDHLIQCDLELKEAVLKKLPHILEHYVYPYFEAQHA